MSTATSADGTPIGYEIHGPDDAPTVVWVHGATQFRALSSTPARVAELTGLRVLSYDRRGRGESGDTAPYAVQREIEDITALIDVLGGRATALLGESSGGVLALEAARAGVAVDRVVAYEPPFIVDDSRPPLPGDYVERLDERTAASDPAGSFSIFLTEAVGLPAEMAAGITFAPNWDQMATAAPTIAYDGRIMRDYMAGDAAPVARFSEITVPVLVGVGGDTDQSLRDAADTLVPLLADGRLEVFPGGTHQTDPDLIHKAVGCFVRGES